MGVNDLPENLKKYVKALDGIKFDEWKKLSFVMNRSFENMHDKATKDLKFCPNTDVVNPF